MATGDKIILVGMAGTGKSTIGSALATKLGWTFVDSDVCIEEREGRAIPVIFAEQGEAYFRKVETEVLLELLKSQGCVIATGGGAVLAEQNRHAMLEEGLVVALKASADTIITRLIDDVNRPLLKGNPTVEVPLLLEKRKHAYDFAHLRVQTDGLTVESITEKILQVL